MQKNKTKTRVKLFSFKIWVLNSIRIYKRREVGLVFFLQTGLRGIQEHEVHKQTGRRNVVPSLVEHRDMAISWKTGSERELCQQNEKLVHKA